MVESHNINVNNFGIGYISLNDYKHSFYPKIAKGKNDITREIKAYNKGKSLNRFSDIYTFSYLSFIVPGQQTDPADERDYLLKVGAIDTGRLPKKNLP